ncbi:MAG: hypothetical protein VKK80_12090 [Prochlorothrix sp.]|nr:hypothetical protein [Prochlorothrix sp.]
MVKRQKKAKAKQASIQPQSVEELSQDLQKLRQNHHYAQAIKRLEQIQRLDPQAPAQHKLPSKGELMYQLGQHQWANQQAEAAERSWQQAIEQHYFEAYYPLAKLYLEHDRPNEAHTLLQTAFNNQTLPKTLAGAYLKVLFLVDATDQVATLLATKSSRFYAHQRHWATAMLALQVENDPESAYTLLAKITKPVTPNEPAQVWRVYQALHQGRDTIVAMLLEMTHAHSPLQIKTPIATLPEHPALRALAWDYIVTRQVPIHPTLQQKMGNPAGARAVVLANALEAVQQNNYSTAIRILGTLDWGNDLHPEFPELAKAILHYGADRLWEKDDVEGAEQALLLYSRQFGFDIEIARKKISVFDFLDKYKDLRRCYEQVYEWIETTAQNKPEEWPEERRKTLLCETLCRQFATYIYEMPLPSSTLSLLQKAQELRPDYYVIKGYQGFWNLSMGRPQVALEKFLSALEGDTQGRYPEFYELACEGLEHLKDDRLQEVQQRFGPRYEDDDASFQALPGRSVLDMPEWRQIFLTPSVYTLMQTAEGAIESSQSQEQPPGRSQPQTPEQDLYLGFCDVILQSLDEDINQKQPKATFSTVYWSRNLPKLYRKAQTPEQQGLILELICITIARFFKRKKGVAGLFKDYYQKLEKLAQSYEPAQTSAWIARMLWDNALEKFRADLEAHLHRQPSPVLALAQLQLEMRLFAVNDLLRPLLQSYTELDSSVPQILLAIATTYPPTSQEYKTYKTQSFQLAQRLQDQEALAACRVESDVVAYLSSQNAILKFSSGGFRNFSSGMADLQLFMQSVMGSHFSEEDMKRMLPELLDRILSENLDL